MVAQNENISPKEGTKAWLQMQLNDISNINDVLLRQNSYLVRRAGVSASLGKSFSGDRDTYESFGYPKTLTSDHYLNFYERDGLATRTVNLVSSQTWRKRPVLLEGENAAHDKDDDPGPLQKSFNKLSAELQLWSTFKEADVSCGISRFALMFLGLPGKPEEPVTGKRQKLAYITVHDENTARVDESSIMQNVESERFGLPEFYNIILDEGKKKEIKVHHTRVIHVREGRSRRDFSRVYGVPRLEKIANRLFDLEKVVGSGSEAFWLLIYRGLALSAKDGMTLPDPDTTAYKNMQDEIEEYMHGLRRYMRLVGMDIQDLGGTPVDSSSQFDVVVTYIAGSSGVPKRILLGSERGELASSQDTANFADLISDRQVDFAEPYILRPFVDRMGELGVLKVPEDYTVYWPSLFQLTDLESATLASTVASALSTISGGAPETVMPPSDFARIYLDYTPSPEAQAEMDELQDEGAEQDDEMVDLREAFGEMPEDAQVNRRQAMWIAQVIKNVARMPPAENK